MALTSDMTQEEAWQDGYSAGYADGKNVATSEFHIMLEGMVRNDAR